MAAPPRAPEPATQPPSPAEPQPETEPDLASESSSTPQPVRTAGGLGLIDRMIPFLAAFVGLIALAGAIIVQLNADAGQAALRQELQRMRGEIAQLSEQVAALPDPTASAGASAEALAEIAQRLEALETAPVAAAPVLDAGATDDTAATAEAEGAVEGPTTDCIPVGTRFMALPGESYPLCRTTSVVQVGSITADTVDVSGSGTITENSFGKLAGTDCTIMVFSADIEGFAEMRVSCD